MISTHMNRYGWQRGLKKCMLRESILTSYLWFRCMSSSVASLHTCVDCSALLEDTPLSLDPLHSPHTDVVETAPTETSLGWLNRFLLSWQVSQYLTDTAKRLNHVFKMNFVVHKVEGFHWNPPWTWIKPPKLYVRVDSGSSKVTAKTTEIDGARSEWDEEVPL